MENNNRNVLTDFEQKKKLVKGALYIILVMYANKVIEYYIGSASVDWNKQPKYKNVPAIKDQMCRRIDQELNGSIKCNGTVYYQAKALERAKAAGASLAVHQTYFVKENMTLEEVERLEDSLVAYTKLAHRDCMVRGGKFCTNEGISLETATEVIKLAGHFMEKLEPFAPENLEKDLFCLKRSNDSNGYRIGKKEQKRELPELWVDTMRLMFQKDPYRLYQQSNVNRWNCLEMIKKENLAEHHCYTAQILLKLISVAEVFTGKEIDLKTKYSALAAAVVHDLGELRFGDMNIMLKGEYPELGRISNEVEHTTIKEFPGFTVPFSDAQDDELARILYKLADHIDMHLYLERENMLGNKNEDLDEVYSSTCAAIEEAYGKLRELL